ncbi:sugar phosphate nucleotidyltransferase [Candidatus Similichlamydia epinepheli]|uniref:sugar phosphate nucleotidyltransferase n=1 Tax=Candidatus Similichlamydia epinepheli TaxID=1903953 RepID=UPI000D3A17C0|nr:sugar phosphate nucleotidyltransferase [Candidatus Similichlamydia epinepheli]
MFKVAAVILSGGEGVRLRPLTEHRCKPALPLMGRYTLIDVVISNALSAGIEQLFIVTQYLSHSLHQCVSRHYSRNEMIHHIKFIGWGEGRALSLGTADAVRKSQIYLQELDVDYLLILSSDQIYTFNFLELFQFAEARKADLVICTVPVHEKDAKRMGIMQLQSNHVITRFVEKPNSAEVLDTLRLNDGDKPFHANMGIYLFRKSFLFKLLDEDPRSDFGMHILPEAVLNYTVWAYPFNGFWKDVGTPFDYFEYHLDVASGIGHRPTLLSKTNEHLSPTQIGNATVKNSMICDSCSIGNSLLNRCLIGPHSVIGDDSKLQEVVCMGGSSSKVRGTQIGMSSSLKRVLADQDTIIGNNVRLENIEGLDSFNHDLFQVKNGIIILPQETNIPDHFVF